jgi:RHS repeat-associated protein
VTDANNHKTTYSFDTRDRVRRTTDALGHSHEDDYDSSDNVTFLRDGLTNQTSFTYSTDGKNNLTTAAEANGATTQFTYGDVDNAFAPDTRTDSSGNKTTYAYTAPGNLTGAQDSTTGGTGSNTTVARHTDGTIDTLTDANNRITDYTYTYASGLLTKLVVTPPSGSVLGATTTNFDSLGRVSSVVDGKGQTRSFTYDKIDRVKSETVGSLTVSRTYDANGNLTGLTDPTGATSLTYDELNRNLTKTAPSRPTITYTYDGVGNLKTLTDAGGQVSYRYDAANRMDQLTEPGSKISTFGYDNADRRTSISLVNGVAITLGYDKGGRQNSIKAVKASTTIVDLKYCYKKVAITDTAACTPADTGNTSTRYKLTDSRLGTTTNFAYDTMSRLKQAKTVAGGTDDFQYAYDKASNRTKQVVSQGGSTTTTFYGYGTGNELCWSKVTTTDPGSACTTPSGATTYNHDANGNMTGSSAGFSATYNGLDQATSITAPGGSALTPMTYGGSDQTERRRAGATNFTDSALGLQVAAPTSGGTGTFYTRDQSGNLISQRTPSGTHYYVLDALGSVVALTDSAGAVVGRYAYEPYGKPTHSGTVTSNFQFASGFYDSQTKLVKFGARYYDPALGRWTQRDPLTGSLMDPKSLNRYAYAGCDPVNNVDPSGTLSDCAWGALILAVGGLAITAILTPLLGSVALGLTAMEALSALGWLTTPYVLAGIALTIGCG